MRIRSVLMFLILLLAGCAQTMAPEEPIGILAVAEGLQAPNLPGIRVVSSKEPSQLVKTGQATAALIIGPVPDDLSGFTFAVDEVVLMQGWLDEPLAFSKAEAETLAAKWGPPGQPSPGSLACGRLSDLQPGWRPIAIDGVTPSPDTVWSGSYPLTRRTSMVYLKHAEAKVQRFVEQLRTLAQNPPNAWAQLSVAGDFMLARGVGRAMREKGTLYPIERVKEHLATADIAFANLESPIGVKGTPIPNKGIWFRAAPEAIEILKTAGLDAVAVANNHIMDYDTENFLETLQILEGAAIRYAGGGRNMAEARQPAIVEAKGIKVAFLAYSQFADLFWNWEYPKKFAATEADPGVAGIREDWLAQDIQRARGAAHIVAVAYHWGEEYTNYPSDEMRRIARLTIDLGADLVLGFHPHAIQGFELYKSRFIAYSTGNFVMDWQDAGDITRESMILDFAVSREGVRAVAVLPVWIQAEQPYIMQGEESKRLLQKMREISGWR